MPYIKDSDPGATGLHPWNALTGQTNAQVTGTVNPFALDRSRFQTSNFAPTIGQAGANALGGNAQGNATAGQQSQLDALLMGRANGTAGPSPAEIMLRQQLAANQQQAAGAIASQRGMSPALAQRLVLQQQAAQQQQAAGQGALLRAQEQLGAQGLLGQQLGTQRSQDIGQQQANTSLYGTAGQLQGAQNANQLGQQTLTANVAENNAQRAQQADMANLDTARGNATNESSTIKAGIGGITTAASGALGLGATGAAAPVAASRGGLIPGHARAAGDSPRNDTVPAVLSPGEVVLPRSVTQSPDAPARAAAFLARMQGGDDAPKPKGRPIPATSSGVSARLATVTRELAAIRKLMGAK